MTAVSLSLPVHCLPRTSAFKLFHFHRACARDNLLTCTIATGTFSPCWSYYNLLQMLLLQGFSDAYFSLSTAVHRILYLFVCRLRSLWILDDRGQLELKVQYALLVHGHECHEFTYGLCHSLTTKSTLSRIFRCSSLRAYNPCGQHHKIQV